MPEPASEDTRFIAYWLKRSPEPDVTIGTISHTKTGAADTEVPSTQVTFTVPAEASYKEGLESFRDHLVSVLGAEAVTMGDLKSFGWVSTSFAITGNPVILAQKIKNREPAAWADFQAQQPAPHRS